MLRESRESVREERRERERKVRTVQRGQTEVGWERIGRARRVRGRRSMLGGAGFLLVWEGHWAESGEMRVSLYRYVN